MVRIQVCSLGCAWVCSTSSFILLVICIVSDEWYWVKTKQSPGTGGAVSANGSQLTAAVTFYDLHFGIWERCYHVRDADALFRIVKRVQDHPRAHCLMRSFRPSNQSNPTKGRIAALRTVAAGCLVGGAVVLFSVQWLLLAAFWPASPCRTKKCTVCLWTALLSFFGGLLIIIGQIVFLFEILLDSPTFNAVQESYGWAFYVSWLTSGLCACTVISFMLLARYINEEKFINVGEDEDLPDFHTDC